MHTPIDTIIIIGNGFDIWQGMNTSYSSFKQYYYSHIDEILRQLHLKKHSIIDDSGHEIQISDVELVYGNPFDPEPLPDEFWGSFETSLSDVDAEMLNLFFGKDRSGLKRMRRCIKNARKILQKAFCGWIASIQVDPVNTRYRFGDNCYIINFNYTDTLRKRFGVDEDHEYHIHGEATDGDSLIFGHASHPMEPEYALHRFGGRFRGLYYVDELLYETDKHVRDNIQLLCMNLAVSGVDANKVTDVYILGQSMSPPDLEYYVFLNEAFSVHNDRNDEVLECGASDELDSLEEMANRIHYVIEHVGYQTDEEEIAEECRSSIMRRYNEEQHLRNVRLEKRFMRAISIYEKLHFWRKKKTTEKEELPATRTQNATWHVAYHGEKDRIWKEHVAKELGMQFTVHPSIEECLEMLSVRTCPINNS